MARVRTRPIRNHIRTNVVGYVAIFLFATSGTAIALDGSNTVFSDDIVNGEVKTPDVAPNAITTSKIRSANVTRSDLAADAVAGANVLDGSLNSADVNDNSLTGADLFTDTLTGGDINESTLGEVPRALLGGFGRTGTEGTCDPETTTFITCAATGAGGEINVPAGARALILARVFGKIEFGADRAFGECRLGTSSIGVVPNTTVDMRITGDDVFAENATLVGVTPPLPAGATSFGVDCNQQLPNGAIEYSDASASVVLISGS